MKKNRNFLPKPSSSQGPVVIAVTGGKGGTGKSTVALLTASYLVKKGHKVALCDCDVECPNDYLLLGQNLTRRKKKIYAYYPELIEEKCKKCGLCVKKCRSNAIFQAPGKYPVFIKELCSCCGACWVVCPHQAIRKRREQVGEIFISRVKDDFWLITGLAKSGLEETGPVVLDTKNFALNFTRKKKIDYLILDTAPGTHCPVISALLGCNLALAVTEPTPMGAHDLSLILDLCRKMNLPFEIVLNQADLGDKEKIVSIARRFNKKIKKEIPYSKELAKLYSRGRLVDFNPDIIGNIG